LSEKEYSAEPLSETEIKNDAKYQIILKLLPNKEKESAIKKIVFNVSVSDSAKGKVDLDSDKLILSIRPENDTLDNFKYLAYIGTNFDLVDGIKAKNLFFASNIFIAPDNTEVTGFYISLYGNRTATFRDSVPGYRNDLKAVRTGEDGRRYAVFETADLAIEGYSDNLGVLHH